MATKFNFKFRRKGDQKLEPKKQWPELVGKVNNARNFDVDHLLKEFPFK